MPSNGYLAFVLHSHMPFVRHPEVEEPLEERWLFEAMIESYLPLLAVLENLSCQGAGFSMTLSLSPTLISMLEDELLRKRFIRHLDRLILLSEREVLSARGQQPLAGIAEFYLQRFRQISCIYHRFGCDLLAAFSLYHTAGKIELITCAATHAYLPLLSRPETVRAQIQLAVELFESRFGTPCRGFWLPECAYTPGLDAVLHENGIRYIVISTRGLQTAEPRHEGGTYRPALSPAGITVFGRDPETASQVWDRSHGYPGDPCYREFYSDIGWEREPEYLGELLPGGQRVATGLKYRRITDKDGDAKAFYDPGLALQKVKDHAAHFLRQRRLQLDRLAMAASESAVIVAPYDTELFGHWWFEGPLWLQEVFSQAARMDAPIPFVSLGDYTELHPPLPEKVEIHLSSWGEGDYNYVWLNQKNDRLYRHLHAAEEEMVRQAAIHEHTQPVAERALNQMARELLLAESSDWAFILNAGSTTDYAWRRFEEHLQNFWRLARQVGESNPDGSLVLELESRHNLFPDLDYRVFRPGPYGALRLFRVKEASKLRVLMLTWEYPPRVVGGIAPHVRNLSLALDRLGVAVDVLTIGSDKCIVEEEPQNLTVIRVPLWPGQNLNFRDWVFRFNLAMMDLIDQAATAHCPWQMVHAHDWLVGYAAVAAARKYRLPLTVTIHATEYGRNHGLFNEEQRSIHRMEEWLVRKARNVICCSQYMQAEITRLFEAPLSKVHIIQNGINPEDLAGQQAVNPEPWPSGSPLVLFVGRLVPEKGVQTLIAAAPETICRHPAARFIVAGQGPYEGELRRLVEQLGLGDHFTFTGYLEVPIRNWLLHRADVAVFPSLYEPFGIVALEAMAAGRPTVVADTGGLAEIVADCGEGFAFPPGDHHALARLLVQLLAEPERASQIGLRAKAKVCQRFRWEDIAQATLKIYRGEGDLVL